MWFKLSENTAIKQPNTSCCCVASNKFEEPLAKYNLLDYDEQRSAVPKMTKLQEK